MTNFSFLFHIQYILQSRELMILKFEYRTTEVLLFIKNVESYTNPDVQDRFEESIKIEFQNFHLWKNMKKKIPRLEKRIFVLQLAGNRYNY